VVARLNRCDGAYTIYELDGILVMTTSDGHTVLEPQISSEIVNRHRPVADEAFGRMTEN
jgi:hypothetical protein